MNFDATKSCCYNYLAASTIYEVLKRNFKIRNIKNLLLIFKFLTKICLRPCLI